MTLPNGGVFRYRVADAEWVRFEDSNGYVLLKCDGDAIASNELIAKLSAIPPEAEVYVEIPAGKGMTQRGDRNFKRNPAFLKAEEAIFGFDRNGQSAPHVVQHHTEYHIHGNRRVARTHVPIARSRSDRSWNIRADAAADPSVRLGHPGSRCTGRRIRFDDRIAEGDLLEG